MTKLKTGQYSFRVYRRQFDSCPKGDICLVEDKNHDCGKTRYGYWHFFLLQYSFH